MRQLTQEYLQELFEYRDGELYWKLSTNRRRIQNKKAGTIRPDGYKVVFIDKKNYLAHRVIFLHQRGFLPECLDHIDNNPSNNLIENLRPATRSQNMQNKKLHKNNTTGVKGVYFVTSRNKWYARIREHGKLVFHKYCKTLEEAQYVLTQAREQLHKEFARHE